jgi:asparagine synthase (glutamine-hydrolysing)
MSAELVARMEEAVRIRLVAEVPLGAFLSGGVDSSSVVAMMSRVAGGEQVNTCSIGFSDPRYNESEYAQAIAQRYDTNHHVREVDPDGFDLIDTLASVYDEPFADPSAIPTYRLCQLARQQVTVALSGDGGDEMLAGYTRYRYHMAEERLRDMLPFGVRSPIFGALGRIYLKADWAPRVFRARSTFQSLAMSTTDAYFNTVSLMNDYVRADLCSSHMLSELQSYSAKEVFRSRLGDEAPTEPLALAQYRDVKTYLAGDILTKVDRASMAHSLEVRVPLLDHKPVEWMGASRNHFGCGVRRGSFCSRRLWNRIYLTMFYRGARWASLYRSLAGFEVR